MSLFEQFPPSDARNRSEPCCAAVAGDDLVTQYAHELGHSRVPFSLAQLAELAGVDGGWARDAVDAAIERGWIDEVMAEAYMTTDTTGLYVGKLARKR